MGREDILKNNLNILTKRFPRYTFYSLPSNKHYSSKELKKRTLSQSEIKKAFLSEDLSQVEILYIVGLGKGEYYLPLKKWLHEKNSRKLVLLEPSLKNFFLFLKEKNVKTILQDRQVDLFFLEDELEKELIEIVTRFSRENIHVFLHPAYEKKRAFFEQIQTLLKKLSFLSYAIREDSLYFEKLFSHFLNNLKKARDSFYLNDWKGKFQNIPVILCGAGPSLAKNIHQLKDLSEKALVVACGSAATLLQKEKIYCSFAVASDPNPEEYERLKRAYLAETPLLYLSRLNKDVFSIAHGPLGYLFTGCDGVFDLWLEKELGLQRAFPKDFLDKEALSITTIAMALMYFLGCNPIIFCGLDLAYTGNKKYMEGIIDHNRIKKAEEENSYLRKDIFGKKIVTKLEWLMEKKALSAFAHQHKETLFLNATEGGLGLDNVENISLYEVKKKHLLQERDLMGLLHREVQTCRCSKKVSNLIDKKLKELQKSLQRSIAHIEAILKEKDFGSAKAVLEEIEWQEEIAYAFFALPILEQMVIIKDKRGKPFSVQEKWQFYHERLCSYLKIMQSF